MSFRVAIAALGVLLATQTASAAAQRTGDRARLVFTISGAYLSGKGLWSIPNQPIQLNNSQTDLVVSRSIQSTVGAALGATYFPASKLGVTAEAFLMGLGYDDACRVTNAGSAQVIEVCQDIDTQERSAAAVALSLGGIFRIASREFISPFARASAGLLLSNQSSVAMQGISPSNDGALLLIYNDDTQTRIRPAFGLGVGATMVLSRGYHLRWEVRDNIVGIERVDAATPGASFIPPHSTTYKHLFSVLIGLDVILERHRGRRY
jgi:hypothetical protein